MTTSNDRIEPRHEVAASDILNTHTHGIVRECDAGPIEEVTGHLLVRDIALSLASAELRGRIEELKDAASIISAEIVTARECEAHAATLALGAVKRAISTRLASLQPEVAKREEGR